MELRRKNKPVPAEIKPPTDPEEWIARANADGESLQAETIPNKPARRPSTEAKRRQPERQEKQEKPNQILPPTPTPSAGSRYISFSMDTVTLGLFRELSFTLDKGNVATLVHVIHDCSQLTEEEFRNFPESRLVSGHAKRTMSFLLPENIIDTIQQVARRLHFRNKSALYRYLIQFYAQRNGISIPTYL